MVVEVQRTVVDGHSLKWLFAAGVAWLAHHRERVNSMNVFPVPDGDTGTNMLVTVQKANLQIATLDETHIGIVSDMLARGALMGARGNSGTILSMLLRGFANGLKRHEVMDGAAFAEACQSAVDYAYETVSSVMTPVEGTILTVAREAAAALTASARTESDLRKLLHDMIAGAHQSLARTPDLLPRLKEAGVVDSGGMGLVYLLEGMMRLLEGEPVVFDTHENGHPLSPENQPQDWQAALEPDDEEGYGYDVQFLMVGDNMDVQAVRAAISAMGWSPLVDGDATLIKVHVHVFNPGEPLGYAATLPGVQLDDVVVENMQAQYLQYVQQRSQREASEHKLKQVQGVAIIAVARGAGLIQVMEDMGAARIVEGGQTMNPGTEDFVSAINSLQTDDIIILPNNGNIILAAEEAAKLAQGKTVRVMHTKTIPQGIAALVAYGGRINASSEEVHAAMVDAVRAVISCEITRATRSVTLDGVEVQAGDWIGMLNGRLAVAHTDMLAAVRLLLERGHAEDYELATLYYGADVTQDDAHELVDALTDQFPALTFEVVAGNQPLYPYLISLE